MPRLLCPLLLAGLAACYQPSYEEGVACGPGGACPDGLTCRGDGRCRRGDDPTDSGPGVGPRDASTGALADSGAPDAAPVACAGDGECQVPPTLCQLPGTCDLEAGLCAFPAVDCSSLDGECTRGSCDLATGSCIPEGINQDALCGQPQTCDPFSACGPDGMGNVCDSTGVQTRSCRVSKCQAGTCTRGPVIETASCTFDPTGMICGDTTQLCEDCVYVGACNNDGTQDCTCTSYACSGGTCAPTEEGCLLDCLRNTDGQPCFNDGTCYNGVCEPGPDPCEPPFGCP